MEYVQLGNSGLRISKIVLGWMSYGASTWQDWVLDEDQALPVIKAAYDAGINTWDTANIYSHGQSEELLGKAIKKYAIPRENLVVLTKCFVGADLDPNASFNMPVTRRAEHPYYANATGLSRTAIFNQVNASLKRLDLDYIDLLWIHRCDKATPKEETMKALHDLVQSGKVRYIGASSMWAWEFAMYQHAAERNGWTKFIAMQNSYSALYREEEREMIPYCKETGVGVVPWFALNSGRLARPVSKQGESGRSEFNKTRTADMTPDDEEIIHRVEEVAKKRNLTMAQVASRWVGQQVTAPLLGINKVERVQEFVDALKHDLTEEEIKYIGEPYQPHPVKGHV